MAGSDDGDTRLASGKSAVKNRLAQQRYRQKQKQKQRDAQEEIQALQARLAELEVRAQGLDERNRYLEAASAVEREPTDAQEAQEPGPANRQAWQSPGTPAALAHLLNGIRRSSGSLVTAAEAAQLPVQIVQTANFEYISTVACLLVKAGDPESSASQELCDYIMQQREAWFVLMNSLDTSCMRALILEKQRTKTNFFKPSMVEAMRLAPEQRQALLAVRRQSKLELDAVEAKRAEAAALLTKAEPAEPASKQWAHLGLLDKQRASELLQDSLALERRNLTVLKNACYEIITPLQEARALCDGFPDCWLDFRLLTEYLEEEHNGTAQPWLAARGPPQQPLPHLQPQPPPLASAPTGLSAPSGASSHSWQSGTGHIPSTLFEAAAPDLAHAGSSGSAPLQPELEEQQPMERFPSIPPELLSGLAGEADQWMELLDSSGPNLQFSMQ